MNSPEKITYTNEELGLEWNIGLLVCVRCSDPLNPKIHYHQLNSREDILFACSFCHHSIAEQEIDARLADRLPVQKTPDKPTI